MYTKLVNILPSVVKERLEKGEKLNIIDVREPRKWLQGKSLVQNISGFLRYQPAFMKLIRIKKQSWFAAVGTEVVKRVNI